MKLEGKAASLYESECAFQSRDWVLSFSLALANCDMHRADVISTYAQEGRDEACLDHREDAAEPQSVYIHHRIRALRPGGRRARRRAPKALCECHVWCVASPHLPPAFDRSAYVCHATSVARAGQAERARGDGAGEADQGRDEHAHRARGAGAVDRELDVEEVIARGSVLIVCTILSLQLYCMNEGIPSMRLGRRERKRNVWGSETAGACATPVVDPTSATFDSYYITFLSLRNGTRWS